MASHPSPFCRQRQSNKALDPNGQTAKFLYTMLKQLDLKSIDWNEIARDLDITNGHAARMRWSRFRAQIEGLDNSYSRKGGKKKDTGKKRKSTKGDEEGSEPIDSQFNDHAGSKRLKLDPGSDIKTELGREVMRNGNGISLYRGFKSETEEAKTVIDGVTIHHPTVTTITVPQTSPPHPINPYRPNNSLSVNPPSIGSQSVHGVQPTQSAQAIPMQGSRLPYGMQTGYAHEHWPQQSSMTYPYPYPSRSNFAPSGYYQSSSMNPSQYQYPAPYATQQQPRFNYAHPSSFNPAQQGHSLYQNNTNSGMPTHRNTTTGSSMYNAQMAPPMSRSQPSNTLNQGTTSFTQSQAQTPASVDVSAPSTSKDNAQPQQNAMQLAAEASYPWPYSEASVSNFTQPPTTTEQPEVDLELPTLAECLSSGLEMTFDGTNDRVSSITKGEANIQQTGILPVACEHTHDATTSKQGSITNPVTIDDLRGTIVKAEPDLLP